MPHVIGRRLPPSDTLLGLDTAVVRAELVAARLRRLVEERDRLGLPTAHTRNALAAAERQVAVMRHPGRHGARPGLGNRVGRMGES